MKTGITAVEANSNIFEPQDDQMNEIYLWHGTAPRAALSIAQEDFNIKLAGASTKDHAGSMYGDGTYLAESITKADEYAQDDPTGLFAGKYALLLCRVLLGSTFRVTDSNIPAIEAALATGHYQSVLGDREAAVGTYREFIVYDHYQVYPHFIVWYTRL